MPTTLFNGLEIDVPDGWADISTVVLAPRAALSAGEKPTINLVVKRRPMENDDTERSLMTYLQFMNDATANTLSDVVTKDFALPGAVKGRAVSFHATIDGSAVKQTTLLFFANGEEVSATVTQGANDKTPAPVVEKLLRSVRSVRSARAAKGGA